ncbi:hypothetical protein M406DRAFT_263097, partial [Cryphonectria parasitica EP155]
LRRVGWATHLQGLDLIRTKELVSPIWDNEPTLQALWQSFQRNAQQARYTAVASVVSYSVLFEINRKNKHIKPKQPFDS